MLFYHVGLDSVFQPMFCWTILCCKNRIQVLLKGKTGKLPGSHAWNHPATLCGTSAQLIVGLSDPQNPHFPPLLGGRLDPLCGWPIVGCKSWSIISPSLLLTACCWTKIGIFFTSWNCTFYGPSVALGFSSNPQPFWATKTDSEPGKKSSSTLF